MGYDVNKQEPAPFAYRGKSDAPAEGVKFGTPQRVEKPQRNEELEKKREIENVLFEVSYNTSYTVSNYENIAEDWMKVTFSSSRKAVFVECYGDKVTLRVRNYSGTEKLYTIKSNEIVASVQRIFENKLQEQMTTYC